MSDIELVPAPGSPTGENIPTAGIPKTVNFTGSWPPGGVAARLAGHAFYNRGSWVGSVSLYVTIGGTESLAVSSGSQTFDSAFPAWSFDVPAGTITTYRFQVVITSSTWVDNVEVWAYALTDPVSVTYCQYGTQLQAPGTFVYYLTPGLIDTILAGTGEVWAAPFLTALWFTTVNARTLCGTLPPSAVTLTIEDFVGPSDISAFPDFLAKLYQWFEVRMWNYFCTCTPAPGGSPAPTPPPTPSQPQPSGAPTVTLFNCDGADLCSLINQLAQGMMGIQQNLKAVRGQVDLLQRYRLPFAYVAGAVHSGLTGSGSLSVPTALVGLRCELTATDSSQPVLPGNPSYYWNCGWMSIDDARGMLEEKRITRLSFEWLPAQMPIASSFAWQLNPGFTLKVTELEAET